MKSVVVGVLVALAGCMAVGGTTEEGHALDQSDGSTATTGATTQPTSEGPGATTSPSSSPSSSATSTTSPTATQSSSTGARTPPKVRFYKDSTAATLTVSSADPGLDWSEFVAGGSCKSDTPSAGAVDVNDKIQIEVQAAGTSCTYLLKYRANGGLVHQATFSF